VGERRRDRPVRGPDDAFLILGPALFDLPDEELHALYVDRRNRPVAHRRLTRGSDGLTIVEPRQVYRLAIGLGAVGVILAHNHPSGDPTPSAEDRAVNERVARVGQVVGVTLLDHLVIGGRRYVSLGNPVQPAHRPVTWTG
jgi:DNA repair protein RadC